MRRFQVLGHKAANVMHFDMLVLVHLQKVRGELLCAAALAGFEDHGSASADRPRAFTQIGPDLLDGGAGFPDRRFALGRDRQRAGIHRTGELVQIVRKVRPPEFAQHLAQRLVVFHGTLAPRAPRRKTPIEQAGADVCAERDVRCGLFQRGPLLKGQAQRKGRRISLRFVCHSNLPGQTPQTTAPELIVRSTGYRGLKSARMSFA